MQQDSQNNETEQVRSTGHLGLKIAAVLVLVIVGAVLIGLVVESEEISSDPTELVQQLGSEDSEVVRRAGEELAKAPRKATGPLTEALAPSNPELLRVNAIEVLTQIRTTAALQAIGQYVTDENQTVKTEAITAVGQLAFLDRSGATQYLKTAFEQSDLTVIETAGEALQTMDFSGATEILEQEYAAGKGPQAVVAARYIYDLDPSDKAASFIVKALSSGDAAVVAAAKSSVNELGRRLVPALVEADTQPAREAMLEVRKQIITELGQTLNAALAAQWLEALGYIADEECVSHMITDFQNNRNESSWRLAAADAMAEAAKRNTGQQARIEGVFNELLANESETDERIKIGAAIALCRLGKKDGVDHLMELLGTFQEAIAQATDTATIQDLAALRIRAQQALVEAGGYDASRQMVVDELLGQVKAIENDMAKVWAGGDIVLWAAAETLGELKVAELAPSLRKYLTTRAEPNVRLEADGALAWGKKDTQDDAPPSVALANWQAPTDEDVQAQVVRMRVFAYPASVRLSAAIALGKLGEIEALEQAKQAEEDFMVRIQRNGDMPGYYQRRAVLEALAKEHRSVLFYLRNQLKRNAVAAR